MHLKIFLLIQKLFKNPQKRKKKEKRIQGFCRQMDNSNIVDIMKSVIKTRKQC